MPEAIFAPIPQPPVRTAGPVVQRACECGSATREDDACPSCSAGSARLRMKPFVGRADDPFEREADAVADRVVGAGAAPDAIRRRPETSELQRQPEEEEEEPLQLTRDTIRREVLEEEEMVQTKAAGPAVQAAAPAAAAAVSAGGTPLSRADRAWFEPRFGRDLSHVRLHTDAEAGRAARGIGARAYALRNHIAFAPGQFSPSTTEGRRLIAHELAHTLQQGTAATIRRTCPSDPAKIPPGGCTEFEATADAIVAEGAFKALDPDDRDTARHIIDGARASMCPMYYIAKLELLISTATVPPASTAARNRQIAKDAAEAEKKRLQDPVFATLTGTEEAVTGSASRKWTTQTGSKDRSRTRKTFQIDTSNLDYIVVRMKVFAKPAGTGTDEDVERTKSLEDGIELEAKAIGYTLDLEFVDRPGPDVFEVWVDPSQWTTAGNWAGSTRAMAHEAHHLLGLADRYNYIESHAANRNMAMGSRLHWFREQMVRAADPLAGQSLMEGSRSASPVNEQDLCALAGGNFRDCLVQRFALRTAAEIGTQAKALTDRYSPANAALLLVLRDAWARRPEAERKADCDTTADPACTTPPAARYGDPARLGPDAAKFPLANPHQQQPGTGLARKQKAPCPP